MLIEHVYHKKWFYMDIIFQDGVDTLIRTQSRALESQLFNKVNEIQEALSAKAFDLRSKQLHLAAINAQVCTILWHIFLLISDAQS